jgi:hypothetical protein
MITKKTDIIAIDAVCDELRQICGGGLLEGKEIDDDQFLNISQRIRDIIFASRRSEM